MKEKERTRKGALFFFFLFFLNLWCLQIQDLALKWTTVVALHCKIPGR